jgi:HrpA-like RNA helicase
MSSTSPPEDNPEHVYAKLLAEACDVSESAAVNVLKKLDSLYGVEDDTKRAAAPRVAHARETPGIMTQAEFDVAADTFLEQLRAPKDHPVRKTYSRHLVRPKGANRYGVGRMPWFRETVRCIRSLQIDLRESVLKLDGMITTFKDAWLAALQKKEEYFKKNEVHPRVIRVYEDVTKKKDELLNRLEEVNSRTNARTNARTKLSDNERKRALDTLQEMMKWLSFDDFDVFAQPAQDIYKFPLKLKNANFIKFPARDDDVHPPRHGSRTGLQAKVAPEVKEMIAGFNTVQRGVIAKNMKEIAKFIETQEQVCVLKAPTGSGKTTYLPVLLTDALFEMKRDEGSERRSCVVCAVPTVTAVKNAAKFVNGFCMYRLPDETMRRRNMAGYRTGSDILAVSDNDGSVTYCTTSVLAKVLQATPVLHGVDWILVDEVDSGDAASEFLVGLIRKLMCMRPDIRVCFMSATVDVTLIRSIFGTVHEIVLDDASGAGTGAGTDVPTQHLTRIYRLEDMFSDTKIDSALHVRGEVYLASILDRYLQSSRPQPPNDLKRFIKDPDVVRIPPNPDPGVFSLDSWSGAGEEALFTSSASGVPLYEYPKDDAFYVAENASIAYTQHKHQGRYKRIEGQMLNIGHNKVPSLDFVVEAVLHVDAHPQRFMHRLNSDEKGRNGIMVFLPGVSDVKKVTSVLRQRRIAESVSASSNSLAEGASESNTGKNYGVFSLYGELDREEKAEALNPVAPHGVRPIVVCTSIAENSLTVNNMYFVIDTGLRRTTVYHADADCVSLDTQLIARNVRRQRIGRVNRISGAGGSYIQLYPTTLEFVMGEDMSGTAPLDSKDSGEIVRGVIGAGVLDVHGVFERMVLKPRATFVDEGLSKLDAVWCLDAAPSSPVEQDLVYRKYVLSPIGTLAETLAVESVHARALVLGAMFGVVDAVACVVVVSRDRSAFNKKWLDSVPLSMEDHLSDAALLYKCYVYLARMGRAESGALTGQQQSFVDLVRDTVKAVKRETNTWSARFNGNNSRVVNFVLSIAYADMCARRLPSGQAGNTRFEALVPPFVRYGAPGWSCMSATAGCVLEPGHLVGVSSVAFTNGYTSGRAACVFDLNTVAAILGDKHIDCYKTAKANVCIDSSSGVTLHVTPALYSIIIKFRDVIRNTAWATATGQFPDVACSFSAFAPSLVSSLDTMANTRKNNDNPRLS